MITETINSETPIWQLTVGEFKDLIKKSIPQTVVQDTQTEIVYGLDGIAEIFDCSKSQAQRIKSSGIIDGAITQLGRKILVDKHLAIKLAKEKPDRRRRRR